MREPISALHRLDITLRFLATGESYRSLMYTMRVHESTISKIVPEVCSAIYKALKGQYLKTPTTEEKWNCPNCLHLMDTISFLTHPFLQVHITTTTKTNSIVLLGLVDANYRFIYANVGTNGRISDGGVFEACNLFKRLQSNSLQLPTPRYLPGIPRPTPYVFTADDAYPLMENVMKPFPQQDLNHENRVYNYRLSRARRMVESSFGILANRWRVQLNPIHLSPEKVELITLTCLTLHNFLATENSSYIDEYIEKNSNTNLQHINKQGGNKSTEISRLVREDFKTYFNSADGAVPWQDDAVKRRNH